MKNYPFLDLAEVNRPFMSEIRRRVTAVVDSGRYVGGSEVELFEKNLQSVTGAPYAIGVSNGYDALHLIMRGYIETGALVPGDEVIVAANTYVASVLAITHAGLVPVLAEPDLSTMNLDLNRLEEYLTPRTRAVMPVHLYGRTCWSTTLQRFAADHNLKIIEDNAQAIGAEYTGDDGSAVRTGALGDAAAFSFYPTKNIGAMGDAGAVTTRDPDLAAAVRTLANYGSDRRYHNISLGFNCRLDPMQAAVLNVKLPHTDSENARRRIIAERYLRDISNPAIILPEAPAHGTESVWHQFVVRTDRRDRFLDYLSAHSVGYDIHYSTPPFRQLCYTGSFPAHAFPKADLIADTCVSLPTCRPLTPDDASEIAAIINRYRP